MFDSIFLTSVEDVKPSPDTARENAGQRTKPKVSSHRVKIHRVKIHRLKGKIKTLTASLQKASKSGSINNIIKNASRYLDTSTLDFFASQLTIGKQRLKGRRYTNKDKLFAFAQSPSAYIGFAAKCLLCHVRDLFEDGWKKLEYSLALITQALKYCSKMLVHHSTAA